ncbi:hypothetical protein QVD99_001561 [Batrachochytrium dendrobatidis]|nr:hypothetical protein O5D80_006026 [Batrachochytrium dendrobatidis]KAK5671724.1 hypothetical protein QVD99_001561 [Batrachochytrium dendrobatidis]
MSSRTADLAHATPTKPSMLLKDLRLSSVDLLNPLSSDLMQFTHPSPEYTPQDFCKENDVTQSGMPSTMMSHFANADDISLSCYDNTIQHAIAQDDLLSMMQAIKDSSIASTNNLDDIIMPSIDKQSSSGSLLQFFSQSGWPIKKFAGDRFDFESKQSSQATLASPMSSCMQDGSMQPFHGLGLVQGSGEGLQMSVSTSDTSTRRNSDVCRAGFDGLTIEKRDTNTGSIPTPVKETFQNSALGSLSTAHSGSQWPYTLGYPIDSHAATSISPTSILDIPPLLGTTGFSKSFMERLGEAGDNSLAGTTLEFSDDMLSSSPVAQSIHDNSLSATIGELVQTGIGMSINASDMMTNQLSATPIRQSQSMPTGSTTPGQRMFCITNTTPNFSNRGPLSPMRSCSTVQTTPQVGMLLSPSTPHQGNMFQFYNPNDDLFEQSSPLQSLGNIHQYQQNLQARLQQECLQDSLPRYNMPLSLNTSSGPVNFPNNPFYEHPLCSPQMQHFNSALQCSPALGTTTLASVNSMPSMAMQQSYMSQFIMPEYSVKFVNDVTGSFSNGTLDNLDSASKSSNTKRTTQRRRSVQSKSNRLGRQQQMDAFPPKSLPVPIPKHKRTERLTSGSSERVRPNLNVMCKSLELSQFDSSLISPSLQSPWAMSDSAMGDLPVVSNSTPFNSTMPANRRKMVERAFFCINCRSELGQVSVRTSIPEDQVLLLSYLTCKACESQPGGTLCEMNAMFPFDMMVNDTIDTPLVATSLSSADQKISPTSGRKRSRSMAPTVCCEVCKDIVGVVHKTPNPLVGIPKPEYVCKPCFDTYMFCSECGGGGKQRTGKWRPKELFEAARRTCSLPHVRVGNAQIHYQVLVTGNELLPDTMNGIQDVFYDCMLSLYAVPTMIKLSKFGTYKSVLDDIEKIWRTSVMNLLNSPPAPSVNRYLTVAWMDKRHRNKGKGKFSIKDTVSWLSHINVEQAAPASNMLHLGDEAKGARHPSVSPTSQKSFSAGMDAMRFDFLCNTLGAGQNQHMPQNSAMPLPCASSLTHPLFHETPQQQDDPIESNRSYIAFSMMDWDMSRNTVFITQMAPRSVFLKSLDQYVDLMHRGINQIMQDARSMNLPSPSIVWGWTRNDHIRLLSVPGRLGFVSQEQFLMEHPSVDPAIFYRPEFAELFDEGSHVFAQTIDSFMGQRSG